MLENVIEIEKVCFRRNGRMLLSDISWSIEKGAHWALLGANGSGKTTLLKIITGYEWPTSGSVTVLGQRFGDCNLPELRKAIGWVSAAIEVRLPAHDRAILIVLSGLEASMGVYRHFSDAEIARAHAALLEVGADDVADRPFGLLSQGEQQRVLIARALVQRPALLVLDEPCAGLDPASRALFLSDLASLAKRPNAPTLVMVTHHIEEIGPWITRVLALKAGRIVASGLPGEVLTEGILGDAFSHACSVDYHSGRYWLRMAEDDGGPVCR